jgi:1,4-alpha-glucan branching enzyme
VDAVASMLYRDYARPDGQWLANQYGGRENIEAIDFLRKLNETVYSEYPNVLMIAEESTAWPQVSKPTYVGGLGFGFKWDMGWMHDTLEYIAHEPVHRKFHHNQLTFRGLYMWSENFVLPLSHDEVVYGKRSLLNKMPGDWWQKFANLRLLLGYMWTQPGKKLLFMGGEIGQWYEWQCDTSLDWHLLELPTHRGVKDWVRDLNNCYKNEKAMSELDAHAGGFEWIDCQDVEQSVLTYMRKDKHGNPIVVACNFTPVTRHNYMVGVPTGGYWKEILNSDSAIYGGSGQGNYGGTHSNPLSVHGRQHSLTLTLPPLSMVALRPE